MWNKYVVVDFLPPKKFHSQKAARQKMRHGAPWARAANFVKKPPLIVNDTYLELNDFNGSMWVS